MKRYSKAIILGVLLGLILIAIALMTGVVNYVVEKDNAEIAAETSGITLQIMTANETDMILNMVNSSQYYVDCSGSTFLIQKKNEDGKWEDIKTVGNLKEVAFGIESGENRAFQIMLAEEKEGQALSEGEYRICKNIVREVEEKNPYKKLTIKVEFSYPEVTAQRRSYDKPVESAEIAAKLARTMLPEYIEGVLSITNYNNPEVTELIGEGVVQSVYEMGETIDITGISVWQVVFKTEQEVEPVVVYVGKEDGYVYGMRLRM